MMNSDGIAMADNDAAQLGRKVFSGEEVQQFAEAEQLFPGGTLGGNALAVDARFVFQRGEGSRFWDVSGNQYIDYVLGSGVFFLGHAHPQVRQAITEQLADGTQFFAYLNSKAIEFARRIKPNIACAGKLRFTTSGSDSTFHAIRLARAHTGRSKVLKFEGAYHGVHDYAQFGTAPRRTVNFPDSIPDTAGIPEPVKNLMLVAPFNDVDALVNLLKEHGKDIATIIIEPIQRIISPKPGFLEAVRELCTQFGIVMILDEVVTGLRYGLGGAQAYFNITPDLATYGKIIGGGLPVGAVAGREEIMDQANPSNKGKPDYVYQNGTLQGHMLGCAAGMASLDVLEKPGVYESVFSMADKLRHGLQKVFDDHSMGILVFGEGPMWHMLFAEKVPNDWRDVMAADGKKMALLEAEFLKQGLFFLPGNRRFISICHTEDDLANTFEIADRVCRNIKG